MTAIFEHVRTVVHAEIDDLGHANNVVYVAWMVDAAVAHSTVLGWSPDAYRSLGHGWVVRRHEIDYHRPALPSNRIVIRTWVSGWAKASSRREYEIYRDGTELLAKASTRWAFVNFRTGAPCRIPEEVSDAFPVVADPDLHR